MLLSPLVIKNCTFRNRIVVSPMCQYSAIDGFANNWHLVHLGSRAVGGAGLVIQEATAVSPEGRISPYDAGIWQDAHIEKWKEIVKFIREQGSCAGIQLAHAGRKASVERPWQGNHFIPAAKGGWQTFSASAVPYRPENEPPLALTGEGIQKVISDFKEAAKRSLAAGYDLIEIHGAHGYLIHQFLSPLINQRTDNYGGSFQNRIRLLLEIISAVQEVWPASNPLFVRISATDWAEGGWDLDDSVALAEILKKAGVDLIDCSSGGAVHHQKISPGPGYQVGFAEKIKKETGIQTGAVGLITTPDQADKILEAGKADLIIMARQLLRDPYFPLEAARTLGETIQWPVQYERAK